MTLWKDMLTFPSDLTFPMSCRLGRAVLTLGSRWVRGHTSSETA